MRRNLKVIALASLAFISLTAVVSSTVAWFSYAGDISFGTGTDDVKVTGGSVASYYESGTGTEDDPYIISNRNHVYNLAWLQYIGYYNDSALNNVGIQQKYFKIKNDIDLQGLTIPPIGSEKYPFLGHFDGNNKVLSNFSISNDDPSHDSSDFGVAKPSNLYAGEESEIVGFFGVVGALPSQNITYTSSIVSVENITLKDFTVKSETSNTLIGLAAGYVDGTMSGVKVDGEATLDVDGRTTVAKASITNNLSDYGLVGYTTKTVGSGSYSQSISEWYDSTSSTYGGGTQEPSWGGSVNMKSMYNRLNGFKALGTPADLNKRVETIYANGTSSGESTEKVADDAFVNYKDEANNKGSFCFSKFSGTSSNLLMLTGSHYMKKETTDYRQSVKTLFIMGSARTGYLYPRTSGNVQTLNSDSSTTNPPASYGWSYSESSATLPTSNNGTALLGKISAEIDGVTYYLYYTTVSGSVRARTTTNVNQALDWSVKGYSSGGNLYYYFYATYNGSPYYLRTGGAATTTNNSTSYMFYMFINETPNVTVSTSNTLDESYDTYFPLNVNNSNGASNKNTGYVVSSSDYEGAFYPDNSGVIRLGYHEVGEYSADTSTFYTYNGNEVQASTAGFSKFSDLEDEFSDYLDEDTTKFYGLHFMNSTIDANKCVTIPTAYINGTTISNYKVPKNCIDFSLLEKGTITFFAGTYYTDANAFFSLYKINRSGSNISSIEEIKKIYKKNGDDTANYLYETSNSVPDHTGYTLVFNTEWITNPSINPNKIYYFEIPMNAGEYALGSVSGRDGAYLMYLDIATNGGASVDIITGYSITTNSSSISYPVGVDFNVVNVGAAGGDSMCVSIATSKKGKITFAITSTNIAISNNINSSDSTVLSVYSYQGTNYSDSAASGKFTVSGNSPGALPESTNESKRVIYATVLTSAGVSYSIVVTDVLSGTTSTTFTVDGVAKADLSAVTATVPAFTGTVLTALRTRDTAITLTRSGNGANFNATPTYSVSNRKEVVITLDVTGVSVEVSNIDDYSFYKNALGQANRMTNGNTYTFQQHSSFIK